MEVSTHLHFVVHVIAKIFEFFSSIPAVVSSLPALVGTTAAASNHEPELSFVATTFLFPTSTTFLWHSLACCLDPSFIDSLKASSSSNHGATYSDRFQAARCARRHRANHATRLAANCGCGRSILGKVQCLGRPGGPLFPPSWNRYRYPTTLDSPALQHASDGQF